jgi:hypothetical protein
MLPPVTYFIKHFCQNLIPYWCIVLSFDLGYTFRGVITLLKAWWQKSTADLSWRQMSDKGKC